MINSVCSMLMSRNLINDLYYIYIIMCWYEFLCCFIIYILNHTPIKFIAPNN